MASQMHKVSRTYWKPDQELAALLRQELIRLNLKPRQDTITQLISLCKEPVDGLIQVTQQYSNEGSSSEPYNTIIAAPSLATLGMFSVADPPGINFSDFWEYSA
jgi:hypothetical protein